MDRQTLLVQKRQRLEELRKKRLESTQKDENQKTHILDEYSQETKPVKQVSIGIQVDSIGETQIKHEVSVTRGESEVIRFDKAVQTMDIDVEDVIVYQESEDDDMNAATGEQLIEAEQEDMETIEVKDVNELNKVIKDSIKQVNRVIMGEYIDLGELKGSLNSEQNTVEYTDDDSLPLKQVNGIKNIPDRQITSMDVSAFFPDLIVASYSQSKRRDAIPGLAVVYDITKQKPFQEFYLNANSTICCVQFDKFNSRRVVGGLVDGSVVIWDLDTTSPSKVDILPVLSTPSLKLYHNFAVTSIIQARVEKNNCIITASSDGHINLWSANFLEIPKTDTVKLYMPKELKEFNSLKDKITLSSILLLEDEKYKTENLINPDRSFLNQIVIASNDGKIIKLSNTDQVVDTVYEDVTKELHPGRITSLNVLTNDLLISSSLDWNLKIWSLNKLHPLTSISTSCSITDIAVRPNNQYQVIVVGFSDKAVAQFWDFSMKMFNPILNLDIEAQFCHHVQFNEEGDKVFISTSEGSILVWSIDQFALEKTLETSHNPDIDTNIQHYISKMNCN